MYGDASAPLLLELLRFGVTQVLQLGCKAPAPAPAGLHLLALADEAALPTLLDESYLACEAGAALDFNLARLLAVGAPCAATRSGGDARIRLVQKGRSAPPHPVAVARLPNHTPRPALFLDRDGTINVDHGYVGSRERFQWVEGALDAIRLATEAGWHVFVVTNQSGVARGFYDEADVAALHDWMTGQVRGAGGNLDDVRYCPFHEAAPRPEYRRASDWRKPGPGMILDLMHRWQPDAARCVLVGDQPSDMAAAANAGIAGRLFPGGNLADTVAPLLQAI